MKLFFLLPAFLFNSLSFAGDSVNNGGGLAEQAMVYSAQHFSTFLSSCLQYTNCGASEPERAKVQALLSCARPQYSDLRFDTNKNPLLQDGSIDGAPYIHTGGVFIINRSFLYLNDQPMRLPAALAHLARLFFDECKILPFSDSSVLANRFSSLAEQEGEQVTIGKDNLDLPASQWLRARTLYSDLLLESSQSLLRLTCPQETLESCELRDTTSRASLARFKDLNLRYESQHGEEVKFELEGHFGLPGAKRNFVLAATFKNGQAIEVVLDGRVLSLPTDQ